MAGTKGAKVSVGKRVLVEGLTGRTELNGKSGVVLQAKEEDKFAVKLDEGTEVILKAANLALEKGKSEGNSAEPKPKKARFADNTEEIPSNHQKNKKGKSRMTEEEDCIEVEDDDSQDDDPPYSTWANKAVTIRLIRSSKDAGISFNLENGYTHQVH